MKKALIFAYLSRNVTLSMFAWICISHLCVRQVGMFFQDETHPLYGRCKLGRQLRSNPITSTCLRGAKSNKAKKVKSMQLACV